MGSSKYDVAYLTGPDGLAEWDRFVDESPQGCIFCRSWWLEAVCPKGFEILILRKAGRIVAGMPMVRSRKWGCDTIHMPPLTQTLGVLLAPPSSQKYEKRLSTEMATLRELVRAIPPVSLFTMRFHHTFTNWLPFYWGGFSQTTRYTYVITELSDLDTLFNNMSKNTRKMIRKAENRGIVVEENADLGMFLELNRQTFARQGKAVPYSDRCVRKLDEACARHKARTILLTKDASGRAHVAVYVVHDQKCMYALMSGSDPELRSGGAHALAKWASLQLAHRLGIPFDFEGSMMENVECFNRRFGARQVPYFQITKGPRRALVKGLLRVRSTGGRLARAVGIRR